jgi:hypothetical protein
MRNKRRKSEIEGEHKEQEEEGYKEDAKQRDEVEEGAKEKNVGEIEEDAHKKTNRQRKRKR